MNKYSSLPRGKFKEVETGLQVFQRPIVVILQNGIGEYKLEELSTVENNFPVGVYTVEPDSDIQRYYGDNRPVAKKESFLNAALTFRDDDDDEPVKRLPLETIAQINRFGQPYETHSRKMRLSSSTIEVFNPETITTGEVLVLLVDFVKINRK